MPVVPPVGYESPAGPSARRVDRRLDLSAATVKARSIATCISLNWVGPSTFWCRTYVRTAVDRRRSCRRASDGTNCSFTFTYVRLFLCHPDIIFRQVLLVLGPSLASTYVEYSRRERMHVPNCMYVRTCCLAHCMHVKQRMFSWYN
jgi:hypothetical protein